MYLCVWYPWERSPDLHLGFLLFMLGLDLTVCSCLIWNFLVGKAGLRITEIHLPLPMPLVYFIFEKQI